MEGRLQAPYPSSKLPRRGHFFAATSAKKRRSFINACDRFIYTEIFRTKSVGSSKAVAPTKSGPLRDFNSDEGFKVALDQSIDAATAESGRANLGAVGNHLLRLLPDFDPRNYGFRKLSDLVEKNPSLRQSVSAPLGYPVPFGPE
jgi:hypothetical protein